MVIDNAESLYRSYRLELYKHIFEIIGEKDSQLTATEFFSAEVIFLMGNPTITEFAECMSIPSAHSAYKIKTLIEKGYIVKTQTDDKRCYRIAVTDKFLKFYDEKFRFGQYVHNLFKDKLTSDSVSSIDAVLMDRLKETEKND